LAIEQEEEWGAERVNIKGGEEEVAVCGSSCLKVLCGPIQGTLWAYPVVNKNLHPWADLVTFYLFSDIDLKIVSYLKLSLLTIAVQH